MQMETKLLTGKVMVVGMGEVGQPLFHILSKSYDCSAVDLQPVEIAEACAVMHICYPFQMPDFVGTTAGYIRKYDPALTVIHSTLAPGTTRRIHERTPDKMLIYSPVRGKHARMEQDMMFYKKFVAGFDAAAVELARDHFHAAGLQTDVFRTPEIAELSKLLETTYFGILIGWAQEVERLAGEVDGNFDEVMAFIREVGFLPSHIFPGYIGGHCVMPNIAILRKQFSSDFLDAVVRSNQAKAAAEETKLSAEQMAHD
jgi:UDP-N-acetyl-D-mannosaminuronate dehydrogenase